MKRLHLVFTSRMLSECGLAVLAVTGLTAVFLLVGRDSLGEAVIAMLYLVPVCWSASRQGQGPGLCAAVVAALMFDYFFIPPFYTFDIARLEGWLMLGIFVVVAGVIVGRIQGVISQAQASERDALWMYELSVALAGLRTPEAIAGAVADHLRRSCQAALVQVTVQADGPSSHRIASAPVGVAMQRRPDRVIPIQATCDLVGEIRIWRGETPLPPEDSRLVHNLAAQTACALERLQPEATATLARPIAAAMVE